MLHTIAHSKDRNHRAGSMAEDEITSVFFGPLEFFETGNVWAILQRLGFVSRHNVQLLGHPTSHKIEFWPKFQNANRSALAAFHHNEPDLLIRFYFSERSELAIIIEVKWLATSSSKDRAGRPDQLARQWVSVRTALPRTAQVSQVYLTRAAAQAAEEIAVTAKCALKGFDGYRWKKQIQAITWAEVASRLPKGDRFDGTVLRWSKLVYMFLEKLNVVPFSGFKNLILCGDTVPFRIASTALVWPAPPMAVKYVFGDT